MPHEVEKQHLLQSEERLVGPNLVPVEEEESRCPVSTKSRSPWSARVVLLLFSSLALNVVLAIKSFNNSGAADAGGLSLFAHLKEDTSVTWDADSGYAGETEAADDLWAGIDINDGTVALGDAYIESMGLPRAQRFPYDESKGIYLLNGYHSLHCLKKIRHWVRQANNGTRSPDGVGHVYHCLDALRQDTLCYADDTPRYTGYQPALHSGTNQARRCKDWSSLIAWSRQHHSCWEYNGISQPRTSIEEAFQNCPEGSPYTEAMQRWRDEHQ